MVNGIPERKPLMAQPTIYDIHATEAWEKTHANDTKNSNASAGPHQGTNHGAVSRVSLRQPRTHRCVRRSGIGKRSELSRDHRGCRWPNPGSNHF